MEEEKKVVTAITVRILMDTLDSLIGDKGRVAIFNYSGFNVLNENPPDYTIDMLYTLKEQLAIYKAIIEIVGLSGSKSLLRHVGIANIKKAVEIGFLDSIKDLEEDERHKESLKLFSYTVGMGKLDYSKDEIIFSIPTCKICEGVSDTKPFCTIFDGALSELTKWATTKEYEIKEVKCRAMGDDICEFNLNRK